MQSKATTVDEYLEQLPDDRRELITAVRQVFLDNLDSGFQETMQYGMIGYSVPHSIYPDGYHCDPKQPLPFAGLASQKNYCSFYLMSIYADQEVQAKFVAAWEKTGIKLDMGKSCIRFKRLEDLPLKVIADTIRRITVKKYIQQYEAMRSGSQSKPSAKKSAKGTKKSPTVASAKKSSKKNR